MARSKRVASFVEYKVTSALKGFKLSATESMDVVDKLTALDLKAATSAGEIAQGLSQFANVGSLAGVNLDEAAAYVATIADVTQMSGSSAGQALKTIISRYGNVKAGAFNQLSLESGSMDDTKVNDVERVLNKLGIDIRDSNLSFRSFSDVLSDIADRWQTLDTVSKKAVSNAFAGVRQQEAFATLLQNWDKYQELLKVSQNSAGTAQKKYETYQESLEAAKNERKAVWEEFLNNAQISQLLITWENTMTWLLKALPVVFKFGKYLLPILEQSAAIRGGGMLNTVIGSLFGGWGGSKNSAGGVKQMGWRGWLTGGRSLKTKAPADIAGAGANTMQLNDQQAFGRVMTAGITYMVMQAMQGYTAYHTAGASHKTINARGEEVDTASSKEAREAARGVAAAVAMAIPVLGGYFGEKIANQITAQIDADRDAANLRTERAQAHLKVLSSLESELATMQALKNAATTADQEKRDDAIQKYLSTLFKSESDETRNLLSKYLKQIYGTEKSIYQVTQDLKDGTDEERAQAAHALSYAQKQAEMQAAQDSRASELYTRRHALQGTYTNYNKLQSDYNSEWGISNVEYEANRGRAVGGGFATGVGAAAGTAGAMGIAAGLLGATGVGIPIAILLTALAAGIGFGVVGGGKLLDSYNAASAARNTDAPWGFEGWANKSLGEKILAITDKEDEIQQTIETKADEELVAAQEQLAALQAVRKELAEYRDYLFQLQNEDNQAAIEAAVIKAGIVGKWGSGRYASSNADLNDVTYFLSDLNTVQAKELGPAALYEMLAQALGEQGLSGYDIKTQGGKYSKYFVNYARRAMSDSNEAIAGVLSGEAYTLNEALQKLGNDQFSLEILDNFARALRVDRSELAGLTDLLGRLKLSELMMSTTELEEEFDSMSGVLTKVADGTQSVTKWMTEIVTKYPELTRFMSDTPRLIEEIVEKMRDLSNQTMRAQFEEYAADPDLWEKTLRPSINSWLEEQVRLWNETGGERGFDEDAKRAVEDLIRSEDIDRLQKGINALNVVPQLNGNDPQRQTYLILRDAIEAAVGTSGITLRSDVWTEWTQKLMSRVAEGFKTQASALEAQKSALELLSNQRQYERDLAEARNQLNDALNQKRRVYRTGVGFVYEADQGAIKKAEENLEEVQLRKDVSAIAKQIDILNAEAERYENFYSTRSKELLDTVLSQTWGSNNYNAFMQALFGVNSGQTAGGVKVDASSFSTQVGQIFGIKEGGSLYNSIWGIGDEGAQAPSWWENTFGTGTESMLTYVAGIYTEILNQEKDPRVQDLEAAYNNYLKLARDIAQGKAVDADTWNTALDEFQSAYSIASNAGLINKGWGGSDNIAAGVYSPYNLARNADKLKKEPLEKSPLPEGIISASGISVDGETQYSEPQGRYGKQVTINANDTGLSWLQGSLDSSEGKLGVHLWKWDGKTTVELPIGNTAPIQVRDAVKQSNSFDDVAYLLNKSDPSFGGLLVQTVDHGVSRVYYLANGQAYDATSEVLSASAKPYNGVSGIQSVSGPLDGVSPLMTYRFSGNEVSLPTLPAWAAATNGNANGTLDLINERGTEAIVTPMGTITALPSHSGIVPADITRNLWELGEIAPSILRVAEAIMPKGTGAGATALLGGEDNSVNINNLTMSVNADGSFDVDAFVNALKARVALTRNTR